MTTSPAEYAIKLFRNQRAWAAWLDKNHADEPGVWLRLAKASSELQSITHAEALDVALCYGWIDGQAKSYDTESWLQKFTPRGRRSVWSKRNRDHIARLTAAGVMKAPGLAAVEAAKSDGRWDRAYDSPKDASVPDDFREALEAAPDALTFFSSLNATKRYPFLYRIQTAVKPETRARRIAQFVSMLQRGETL